MQKLASLMASPVAYSSSPSLSQARKVGWLNKRGGRIHTWHKRWFVLTGDLMFYYKSPQVTPYVHINYSTATVLAVSEPVARSGYLPSAPICIWLHGAPCMRARQLFLPRASRQRLCVFCSCWLIVGVICVTTGQPAHWHHPIGWKQGHSSPWRPQATARLQVWDSV